MQKSEENLVSSLQASELLGVGGTFISAVKRKMGIKSRYFFLSDVRKFLRKNRGFTVSSTYPLKTTAKQPNQHMLQSPQPEAIQPQNPCAVVPPKPLEATLEQVAQLPTEPTMNDNSATPPNHRVIYWRTKLFIEKFRILRGGVTKRKLAGLVGISSETLGRVERGELPTLKSLNAIVDVMELPPRERAELFSLWLKALIGDEADTIRIEPEPEDSEQPVTRHFRRVAELFENLDPQQRKTIQEAMLNKAVIACLPPILAACQALTPVVAEPSQPTPVPAVCPTQANRSRRTELLARGRRLDPWSEL